MLQSKAFVKSARRAARIRLKASPRWWRQYKKAKGGWKYYLLLTLGIGVLTFVIPFLLVGIPVLAGVGLANAGDREILVSFALAATINAAIMVGHGSFLMRELLVSRTLAVVSQMPIDDKDVLANRTWMVLRIAFFDLIICLCFFGSFAIARGGPVIEQVTIGLMGFVEWFVVVAFSYVIPAYFPKLARQDNVGALVGMSVLIWVFGGIAAAMRLVAANSIASLALFLLPTGWPMLLINSVVVEGSPLGWLMLVPVVVSMIAMTFTFARMRKRYLVREISFNDNALATAVLDAEFRMQSFVEPDPSVNDLTADDKLGTDRDNPDNESQTEEKSLRQSIMNWVAIIPQDQAEVELTHRDARDAVRTREFLEPMDWSSMGWIERTVGDKLQDSERVTAEIMLGGKDPSWTKRQAADLILLTAAVLGMLIVQEIWGFQILATVGHLAFFAIFALMRGSWPGAIWRASTGHVTTIMGLLPVHHNEMNRAVMFLAVARCVLFFPFALILSITAIYGFTGDVDLIVAFYIGCKATLILAAIHQWWFLSLQPNALTQPIMSIIRDTGIALLLILTTLGGAIGLFVAQSSELWSFVAALGLFGSGWLAQKWQHRRLLRDPTDFVTTRNNQREVQRRQQEIVNRNW